MREWTKLWVGGLVVAATAARDGADTGRDDVRAAGQAGAGGDHRPDAEFSWGFKDARPGDYQRAYQIQVASATAFFKDRAAGSLDSGKVDSRQSLGVAYAGKALPTDAEVCWRVRVWDSAARKAHGRTCWLLKRRQQRTPIRPCGIRSRKSTSSLCAW
jgi:alpha-L-rhamnosidase